MNRVSQVLAAAAITALAACGGGSGAVSSDDSFLTVPKATAAQQAADRAATNSAQGQADSEEFNLAMNRKELGQKWFLSAYLKQYFPGAVSYGAARSLGTKVVTFQVHNGKLFVMDASGTKKDSETFDPTLIVDAYPIVHDAAVDAQYPPSKWVVFDPASGLNRFGVMGDTFGSGGVQFQTELTFAQRFKAVADGATWEQVFTGYANLPDPSSWQLGENNQFKGSGTLGIALRHYSEGKSFQPAPNPSQNYFFYGDIGLVPNSGQITAPWVKWNIQPGMKPIKWLISDKVKLTEAAYNGKYDLQGALKNAIENWNAVFGFKVLEAAVANPDDSFGDDTVNMIIWDTDPSLGYAFANWRSNPITGEVRGASVYMNSMWVDDADQYWPDDTSKPTGSQIKRQKQPKYPLISWEGLKDQSLCKMWLPRFRGDADFAQGATGGKDAATLTKKQKVEQFITHVVLHEIGHTLGLRHNFMGSNVPATAARPSTSVMDYLLNNDSYPMNTPGDYDADALKYLYGISKNEPAQAFCTDDGVTQDPNCQTFDRGADPLNGFYAKYYNAYLNGFYKTQNIFYLLYWDYWLNKVGNYVRGGADDATQKAALQIMTASVNAPVPQTVLGQNSQMGPMINLVTEWIYARLYLDPAANRGEIASDPGQNLESVTLPQLQANLTNVDGIRSYGMRRMAVDILKKLQDIDAYTALVQSRATIQASRANLSGADAEMTDDLLARIDAATHPYFN